MSDDEVVSSLMLAMKRQSDRMTELRRTCELVEPKRVGVSLIDAPVKALYELSQVSATRSYLRFRGEVGGTDAMGLPIIGDRVQDWAITDQTRVTGHVVVMQNSGSMLLSSTEEAESGLELIASTARSFLVLFEAFCAFRQEVSKLNFEEFGADPLSPEDEHIHVDAMRKFWVLVADTDPAILDSGSRFWSRETSAALTWRE